MSCTRHPNKTGFWADFPPEFQHRVLLSYKHTEQVERIQMWLDSDAAEGECAIATVWKDGWLENYWLFTDANTAFHFRMLF